MISKKGICYSHSDCLYALEMYTRNNFGKTFLIHFNNNVLLYELNQLTQVCFYGRSMAPYTIINQDTETSVSFCSSYSIPCIRSHYLLQTYHLKFSPSRIWSASYFFFEGSIFTFAFDIFEQISFHIIQHILANI